MSDRKKPRNTRSRAELLARLKAAEELITDLVEAVDETNKCLDFAELSTCDDCEEKRTAALAKHAAYRERYTE